MNLDFSKIVSDMPYIAQGLLVTFEFTILSFIIGFLWGTILALFKISNVKVLKGFAIAYTSIFRGTPLMLQLTIIYYATPQVFNYNIPALQAGVIAFSLNSGAYVSEIIRGGILAVDKGQREAAMSLGVPYRRMMIDIILPQGLKNILPSLVNESVDLLKNSALVSTIGVTDVLRRANIIAAEKYIYFEPLLFAGVLYYVVIMAMTFVARKVEGRMRRSD